MKERVIEEAKNKLIKKIIRTRSDACSTRNHARFLRTEKRINKLEAKYDALIQRSKHSFVMGKNEVETGMSDAKLRTKTLEELKNLYN